MNTEPILIELFDRYLENDLNIQEMQDFELRLKNDEHFAESFRLHKEVDAALMQEDVMKFRVQLDKIGIRNSDLVNSVPMVVSETQTPEIDEAILEQDIMALRQQLNFIHHSVIGEAAPAKERPSAIEVTEPLSNQEDSPFARSVDQAILEQDVMDLRRKLDSIGRHLNAGSRAAVLRRRIIIYSSSVAAALILAFGGILFFNQASSSMNPESAFSHYFTAYDGLGNVRGLPVDGFRIAELGTQKYNAGDYKSALELFEVCISDHYSNETILLLAGTSALLVGDPDGALKYFSNWDPNSPNLDEIEWYSAGCFLKKSDLNRASAILLQISSQPDHKYYSKANGLLKSLGKDR